MALFSQRSASILCYVGQYWPHPPALRKIETQIGSKLFHATGIIFSRAMLAHMPSIGAARITIPSAMCWAALARGAASIFSHLTYAARDLVDTASVDLPAVRAHLGSPLALVLARALAWCSTSGWSSLPTPLARHAPC